MYDIYDLYFAMKSSKLCALSKGFSEEKANAIALGTADIMMEGVVREKNRYWEDSGKTKSGRGW